MRALVLLHLDPCLTLVVVQAGGSYLFRSDGLRGGQQCAASGDIARLRINLMVTQMLGNVPLTLTARGQEVGRRATSRGGSSRKSNGRSGARRKASEGHRRFSANKRIPVGKSKSQQGHVKGCGKSCGSGGGGGGGSRRDGGGRRRGGGGGQGKCSGSSDCPQWAAVLSKWGYCQTADRPDGDPNAGKYASDADCPSWAPTCSKWGYCQQSSERVGAGIARGGGIKGGARGTEELEEVE